MLCCLLHVELFLNEALNVHTTTCIWIKCQNLTFLYIFSVTTYNSCCLQGTSKWLLKEWQGRLEVVDLWEFDKRLFEMSVEGFFVRCLCLCSLMDPLHVSCCSTFADAPLEGKKPPCPTAVLCPLTPGLMHSTCLLQRRAHVHGNMAFE